MSVPSGESSEHPVEAVPSEGNREESPNRSPSPVGSATSEHGASDNEHELVPRESDQEPDISQNPPSQAAAREQRAGLLRQQQYPGMPSVDAPVDKLLSTTDYSLFKKYIVDKRRAVPLNRFVWDKKAEHGQLRGLQMQIVRYFTANLLTKGDPILPFHAWAKETTGVYLSVTTVELRVFVDIIRMHLFLRIEIRKDLSVSFEISFFDIVFLTN